MTNHTSTHDAEHENQGFTYCAECGEIHDLYAYFGADCAASWRRPTDAEIDAVVEAGERY